jgi:hypothetical protein
MPLKHILCFLLLPYLLEAQVQQFPFTENFDSVSVPSLPPGWATTANRTPSGDFTTTTSTPRSDPNAAISTNSAISQILISPLLDFSNKEADSLKFYERRSSSHNSCLLIEASTDGGSTFTVQIGDTLHNPGTTSYVLRNLKLPSSLSNKSSVKIRWRVVGNGKGTTGTIRFDDVTITALYHLDASVAGIYFQPAFPVIGDSVNIYATIKNVGIQSMQNILVEFYLDTNHNTLPDPSELFSSMTINQILQPKETTSVQSYLKNLSLGDHKIIVKSSLSGDQNISNDIFHTNLTIGLPPQSVVVNEIMYAPSSPEPEWIELFNQSEYTADLMNWKISNRMTSSKHTLSTTSIILKPQEYCIVTRDIATFTAIHPDLDAQIAQAGSLPTYMFNNTGDAVVLFDSRSVLMDSTRYFPSWGGSDGKSLERIESKDALNDSTNWSSSGDSLGSTPGKQNYSTPLEYDLRLVRVVSLNTTQNSTTISAIIRNAGHQPADNYSVSFFADLNFDGIPQSTELIETKSSTSFLQPKDSLRFDFVWNNPPSGRCAVISQIDYTEDMRLSNNIVHTLIKNSFQQHSIIINEIMYEPQVSQSEYIELYNRSSNSIDLCGWKLSDIRDTSKTSKKYLLSDSTLILGAGDFIVIASDSSIFPSYPNLTDKAFHVLIRPNCISLNNDGDNILLCDLTNQMIDSIHYLPSWHNSELANVAGRSLERINPNLSSNDRRNWSTSANPSGGTPGKQNSLFTTAVPSSATISFSPNPFSPDGDGFEDVTIISYQLPATAALIRMRIYDTVGRLIRALANGEPSGSHGEIIWNGFNDNNQKVAMGIYIVLLEALDAYGSNVQTTKGVVVVAAKL